METIVQLLLGAFAGLMFVLVVRAAGRRRELIVYAVALALAGGVDGRQIQAALRRADPSQFLLTSRGFHWINEYPFNR